VRSGDVIFHAPELDPAIIWITKHVTRIGAEVARLAYGADIDERFSSEWNLDPSHSEPRLHIFTSVLVPNAGDMGMTAKTE
jgi:hypothetical protein